MVRNIFVVGLDAHNEAMLRRLPGAHQYRFHRLFTREELVTDTISVPELLITAMRQLDEFPGSIDGIVGYWDWPVSMMVPILCEHYGLRGTSLRSVVAAEHKYWSRLIQREVIDEVPDFGIFDLDSPDPHLPPGMEFPVWIKPVKSVGSAGAYHVPDATALDGITELLRKKVDRIGLPFEDVLAMVDLPPEVAAVGGRACIVEAVASGDQFTVEGFVHDSEVVVYGVIDSYDYPESSSFLRYQYPGSVPERIRARFEDISRRVVTRMGLESTTFNIEFFWDRATDVVRLLEINVRHSQSHARLFEMVDGVANHAHMVDLALGRRPRPQKGRGPWAMGAKWFLRRFRDGIVLEVPSAERIAAVEAEIPGTAITIEVATGDLLSSAGREDSYSVVLAQIFTAGADQAELENKYSQCVQALDFDVEDVLGVAD